MVGGGPIGFLEFPEDIAAGSWNAFYKIQPGVSESSIELSSACVTMMT